MGSGQISVGDAARAGWERFQAERAAYVERLHAHAEAVEAYNRQMDQFRAQPGMEGSVAPFAPPAEPAPFTLYSTEVGRGFPIELPPGEYAIRVLDAAGQTVPDSQKRLVAFAPRRLGVGFEVVPQERWTVPEQADDPADVVYTVPGGVTYLRAFAAQEFNAEAYARLKNPQDLAATPNRWQWVHVAPLEPATMLVDDGAGGQRLAIEEFAVEQVPGAALGYRVVPFARARRGPAPWSGRRILWRTASRRRPDARRCGCAWWMRTAASLRAAGARWWSSPARPAGSFCCRSWCRS